MGASDPMLLTLPRPTKANFEFRHAHEFIPPLHISQRRQSYKTEQDILTTTQADASERMGTPHRGLPPPSQMALPEPGRIVPPPISTAPASYAGMPEPPRQWQGAEEAMRTWLTTKAEEEKRKQEEERTRQESLRVEQRRIEQTMLLDAIRSGVPPHLIPIIFAGIGSHSLANLNVEWLQQYNNSLQTASQQQLTAQSQSTGSPDARREQALGRPSSYPQGYQPQGNPPPPFGQPAAPYGYASDPMSPSTRSQQTSAPQSSSLRGAPQQMLPRLGTDERFGALPSAQSSSQQAGQTGQADQSQTSPGGGIFFHHWQPPSSSSQSISANQPPTPSEYTNSPKRRKPQTSQPPIMPPTSEPRYNASSFVHIQSPGGSGSGTRKRRLSDTSTAARPSYASGNKRNRSRGNTESSAAISEEDRLRYRQYPVGGPFEERNDASNHGSHYKRSRRSHDHVEASPIREQAALPTPQDDRNSYGPAG